MTKLSPPAQAVIDAFQSASDGCYVNGEWIQDHAGQIAAAIRAVADLVISERCRNESERRIYIRLHWIAAELEGTHD